MVIIRRFIGRIVPSIRTGFPAYSMAVYHCIIMDNSRPF